MKELTSGDWLDHINSFEPTAENIERLKSRFGLFMLQWRLKMGWTQYTWGEYALCLNFSAISYGNLSVIESGRAGELRYKGFWQMSRLNHSIFYKESKEMILTQNLRDRIRRIEPIAIVNDSGEPWGPMEFMLAYFGFIDFPWDIDMEQVIKAPSSNEVFFTEESALMYLAVRYFKIQYRQFRSESTSRVLVRKRRLKLDSAKTCNTRKALNFLVSIGYSFEYTEADTGKMRAYIQEWHDIKNN